MLNLGHFFAWKDPLHNLKSYFSGAFYEPHQTMQNCWAKTKFAEPNWHIFNLQGQILSTIGGALGASPMAIVNYLDKI